MATISIAEGQTATVNPADTLLYPGINSCLTITTVLPQITRLGGHAVLVPEGAQQTLQQICDFIATRNYADKLYIIGDISTWNGNWAHMPQCANLVINNQQVNNVQGIANALGYANKNVIFDITQWGVNTYDINFGFQNNQRRLWAVRRSDGVICTIPNNPSW